MHRVAEEYSEVAGEDPEESKADCSVVEGGADLQHQHATEKELRQSLQPARNYKGRVPPGNSQIGKKDSEKGDAEQMVIDHREHEANGSFARMRFPGSEEGEVDGGELCQSQRSSEKVFYLRQRS